MPCYTVKMSDENKRFSLRLDEDIEAALDKKAEDDERSKSFLVRKYLREGLERDGYLQKKSKA